MWKRDESVKPAAPPAPTPAAAPSAPAGAAPPASEPLRAQLGRDMVNIGKSVVIKGELSGSEDLTIEGHVEGRIDLKDNVLTIGPNGKIKAEVFAKAVVVLGEVTGNVTASEKVDIRDNGSVDGDIASPRVAIAEGAHFRGSVDMQRAGARQAAAAAAGQAEAEPQRRRSRSNISRRSAARTATAAGPARRRVTRVHGRLDSLADRPLRHSRPAQGGRRQRRGRRVGRPTLPKPSYPTKALHKFLASLQGSEGPLLLDLGPVVGSNVTFFGEQLGCRIRVEDIAADIDRHVKDEHARSAAGILREALHAGAGHRRRHPVLGRARLSRSSGGAGAGHRRCRRCCSPTGACSASSAPPRRTSPVYTKYVVVDESNAAATAPIPRSRPRQRSLLNGDIIKLFKDLRVTDSFLMKSKVREMLFRKPARR